MDRQSLQKPDGESYYLTFSPRNPKKGTWSARNIERAQRMIAEGKMIAHGQRLFDIGKQMMKYAATV